MKHHRQTVAVHGANSRRVPGPLNVPVYQSSTFRQAALGEHAASERSDMYYTRAGNPTISAAEAHIAALEGVEAALVFGSGMAAISTTLLGLLSAGDHVVAQKSLYGGATEFIGHELPRWGVERTFVDATHTDQVAAAIRPQTRLLYLESPTNPTLRVTDLAAMAEIAKRHHLITVIDNTSASPMNQRPAEYGIQMMVHSATKYLAGHSDLVCGAVAGRADLVDRIRQMRGKLGGIMDPHAAYLLLRGMKTLALRVERQNRNALAVAQFLERHPRVRRVHYPFLASHPQRNLAAEQMAGGGGLLSFDLEGDLADAKEFAGSLRLFAMAPSLGGVESLVTVPALTSHGMLTPEERAAAGVGDSLVRLAIGVEQVDDLIADLDQALSATHQMTRNLKRTG